MGLYFKKPKRSEILYRATNNLEHRLAQHNSGKVRATKHRTPFVLVYKEKYYSIEEAIKREKFLKTHKGYNYLKRLGFY